jgi:hypothetical protein
MIDLICPECGKNLKVKDEYAGKNGKCPRCSALLKVPDAVDDIYLEDSNTKSQLIQPSPQTTEPGQEETEPESQEQITYRLQLWHILLVIAVFLTFIYIVTYRPQHSNVRQSEKDINATTSHENRFNYEQPQEEDLSPTKLIFSLFMLAILFIAYFSPYFVAKTRMHSKLESILVVNLFLGWTLLGWVVALAWAFSEDNRHNKIDTNI